MRYLSTSSCVRTDTPGLCLVHGSENAGSLLCKSPLTQVSNSVGKSPNKSFSQVNRYSVMTKNLHEVTQFINQQQKALKQLIKEFQIFVGFREQLPGKRSGLVCQDSWSVYLMHAQSLQSTMKLTYMGKALFGSVAQSPIRLHVEENGTVTPFDLPNPCLESLISLRSFLAGVTDHSLPSIKLANSCIAELLNALVDVQKGREKLHRISKEMTKRKTHLRTRTLTLGQHLVLPHQSPGWVEKFLNCIQSLFRHLQPAKPFG